MHHNGWARFIDSFMLITFLLHRIQSKKALTIIEILNVIILSMLMH